MIITRSTFAVESSTRFSRTADARHIHTREGMNTPHPYRPHPLTTGTPRHPYRYGAPLPPAFRVWYSTPAPPVWRWVLPLFVLIHKHNPRPIAETPHKTRRNTAKDAPRLWGGVFIPPAPRNALKSAFLRFVECSTKDRPKRHNPRPKPRPALRIGEGTRNAPRLSFVCLLLHPFGGSV